MRDDDGQEVGGDEDEEEDEDRNQSPDHSPKIRGWANSCIEKIVIVLDTFMEMGQSNFNLTVSSRFKDSPTIAWAKKALEMFITTKHVMNPRHEFALAITNDNNPMWLHEFTSDVNQIKDSLNDMEIYPEEEKIDVDYPVKFDMDSLMNMLHANLVLPPEEDANDPANYCVRVVFLYGRSDMALALTNYEIWNHLQRCPYFFFDVLYLHKPVKDCSKVQDIFEWFCTLDDGKFGYILEASDNAGKIYEQMGKLLAHPLQRAELCVAFSNG